MRRPAFLAHVALVLAAAAFLFPLAIVVLTSLKPIADIDSGTLFALPRHPTTEPWQTAWRSVPIGQETFGMADAFRNSLFIVLPSLVLSVAIGALSGMALSVSRTALNDALFAALVACLFIPAQVAIYPLLLILRDSGLYGSWAGLIFAQVIWGVPLLTLMFRNFFVTVPRDLILAAYVDGAGLAQALWHVLLPICRPIVITATLLQFTYLWNEFLLNLTFAPVGRQPVMVALNIIAGAQMGSTNYNVNMAAALLTAAPSVLAYLFCGRFIVRGVISGACRY